MCSGKDAVSAANKLIRQDGVKFILGPSCTPASGAVVPLANSNNVFLLAATTTAKEIFDEYDYAFRTSPPATEAAKIIGEVAREKYEYKKIAIITEQTEFAKSWSDEFAESFAYHGGEIILAEEYTTGTTDFRTILLKISRENIDAVYVSGQTEQDAAMIIKQMKEIGMLEKVKIIGNPTTIDLPVYESSNQALPEDAFTVIVYSENQELLDKYVSAYDKEPDFQFFYTGALYDAVYMLKEALEQCGEDSACVKDYFVNDISEWDGAVGTWAFNENGDPEIGLDSYRQINIIDGQKVYARI
jgi:branched-chain amino acid transport system substrate-binding protein